MTWHTDGLSVCVGCMEIRFQIVMLVFFFCAKSLSAPIAGYDLLLVEENPVQCDFQSQHCFKNKYDNLPNDNQPFCHCISKLIAIWYVIQTYP